MNKIFRPIILVLTMLTFLPGEAREALIKDVSQLSSNATKPDDNLGVLIDNDVNTAWESIHDATTDPDGQYIEIRFDYEFRLDGDNEDLVVYLRRRSEDHGMAPTAFKIYGKVDDDWQVIAHAYFLFRGNRTKEYSARINPEILRTKGVSALRFYVTANNTKTLSEDGKRRMAMSEFQLYRIGRTENYSENLVDRFRLTTDYLDFLQGYTFINTQSVLNEDNRTAMEMKDDKGNDWWKNGYNGNSEWSHDTDYLAAKNIIIPNMKMLDSTNDPDVKNGSRQPTHVTVHELYAIQGDAIALYPYYQMSEQDQYKENFSHWYDYQTGKGCKYLDFLIDPDYILRNGNEEEGYEYFAGNGFNFDVGEREYKVNYPTLDGTTMEIKSPEDLKTFAWRVNGEGEVYLNAIMTADIDFYEEVNPFQPIGYAGNPYKGIFNGNGHTIKNLKIKRDWIGSGLFGNISDGAVICNLTLDENCLLTGYQGVGVVGLTRNSAEKPAIIHGVINKGSVEIHSYKDGETEYNNVINAGGILGGNWGAGPVIISDCGFEGSVSGGKENGSITGWIGDNKSTISGCYNTGTCSESNFYRTDQGKDKYAKIESCYDKNKNNELPPTPESLNTPDFVSSLGGTWKIKDGILTPGVKSDFVINACGNVSLPRSYGTVATFFHPRDPLADSELQPLFEDPKGEYIIAADFSQTFSQAQHVFEETKEIHEPTIQFRHIFRIKGGKAFAEEFSSSTEKNLEYVRKNMRHITACAGKDFQIRFDSPIPAQTQTRSKWYYKISDSDYRRVCSMLLRIVDPNGKEITLDIDRPDEWSKEGVDGNGKIYRIPNDDIIFYPAESFSGQGSRIIDNVTYNICGGGGSYYRMLACKSDKAKAGRYTVQLIGKDFNGNVIKICDGKDNDLIVQEMQITFLPTSGAVMVTEEELKDKQYEKATTAFLGNRYGEPKQKIDYDEYRYLEIKTGENGNTEGVADPQLYIWSNTYDHNEKDDENKDIVFSQISKYYKWPIDWEQSNYAFGYNRREDYNMYMVANNTLCTPYHAATDNIGKDKNFNKGYGLYDRLFYDTKGDQSGYFYYVNAAADPGVMAKLRLDNFCKGTTIHVSAWIAECSLSPEKANLSFNFVARLKNGERIPLHSHVTGYVPHQGKWMYVYFNFVPILSDKIDSTNLPDSDKNFYEVDYYELELDNNCKSSDGADYMIDDIRVYLVTPNVYANQIEPVCDKANSTTVKISASFDVLLQSLGLTESETGDDIDIYYTFIDKEKYDLVYSDTKSVEEAFRESRLEYKYRGEDTETYYGRLTFNTKFDNNEDYHKPDDVKLSHKAFKETDEAGNRLIVFNTSPTDDNMQSGKEYMIVLFTTDTEEAIPTGGPDYNDFDLGGQCCKSCVFSVKAAHTIKIDGEIVTENSVIDICKNQSPVIQVDLHGKAENGDDKIVPVQENACMDWFDGSMEEFTSTKEGGTDLWEAMIQFRAAYPDAEDYNVEPTDDFTEEMKQIIEKYAKQEPEGKIRPRLHLYQRSYIFPPINLPDNQSEGEAYVLAIPIEKTIVKEGKTYLICTQPTEVGIKVRKRAPLLSNGIPEGITYPDVIDWVPLRIGLRQLANVSSGVGKELWMPIRKVVPVTKNVSSMQMSADRGIYLVGSTDPEYIELEDPDAKSDDGSNATERALMSIGELTGLSATKDLESEGIIKMKFNNSFRFKEGYEYKLRFNYQEKPVDSATDEEVCDGQVVFIIKVVPEYQKWTGIENQNWNNDLNWRRISSTELCATAAKPGYTTDDSDNDNKSSYAPLDFTKVIIANQSEAPDNQPNDPYPHLFENKKTDITVEKNIYNWSTESDDKTAGEATLFIKYDMAATIKKNDLSDFADGNVHCRPWYANTCEQIHFESGSEIMNQQHLTYQKAWVDMEVSPSRWYTLSSPLRSTVAGDMYLPTAGARQNTEYFTAINFTDAGYDRFKPAVFQRSWNKASAAVYEFDATAGDAPRNVRVLTTWSNVFNDVNETYGAGQGFSVKADVSKLENEPEKVLFRLPKADMKYSYFTEAGATNSSHDTDIDRSGHYLLNPTEGEITVVAATESNKYFLVGNPFMAHLDMKKFLDKNSGKILSKYWIMTGDRQQAGIMTEDGNIVGTVTEGDVVGPMQGFFVEAINGATEKDGIGGCSLTLDYDSDMMCVRPEETDRTPRSGGCDHTVISISAEESGSEAMVILSAGASQDYVGSEDVALIVDPTLESPSTVYTIAGNMAVCINNKLDIAGTEVGVIAAETGKTTLRFSGAGCELGLMLHDRQEDCYMPIYDGMEYSIHGEARDRLFIVTDIVSTLGKNIDISINGRTVKVTSPEAGLEVNVYDTMGRCIANHADGSDRAEFNLCKGIYIVKATDPSHNRTEKILVR